MRPLIGISTGRQPSSGQEPDRFLCDHSYAEAILAAGAAPLLLVPLSPPDILPALVSSLDGFLLSGGGDIAPGRYRAEDHQAQFGLDPERDEFELALVEAARSSGKALLGICRGCQLLAVALGGTLWQDLPSRGPGTVIHRSAAREPAARHRLRLAAGSRLASIFGKSEITVNSSHHQAPRELAGGLRAVAWSEDGLIEGVEAGAASFLVGVQWHPERMYDQDPLQLKLFRAFVQAAGRGRESSAAPSSRPAPGQEEIA